MNNQRPVRDRSTRTTGSINDPKKRMFNPKKTYFTVNFLKVNVLNCT